jgi:hypothetical protein
VAAVKWIYLGHVNGDKRGDDLISYCKNELPSEEIEEGYRQAQLHLACLDSKRISISSEQSGLIH